MPVKRYNCPRCNELVILKEDDEYYCTVCAWHGKHPFTAVYVEAYCAPCEGCKRCI